MSKIVQPWHQQPDETPKAYAAFLSYLDLGPDRSIDRAYRLHTGYQGATAAGGWFKRWASEHSWFERATAYDSHELAERVATRTEARERARQTIVDAGGELAETLVALARNGTPKDYVRLGAVKEALRLAGLDTPTRLAVEGGVSLAAGRPEDFGIELTPEAVRAARHLMDVIAAGPTSTERPYRTEP